MSGVPYDERFDGGEPLRERGESVPTDSVPFTVLGEPSPEEPLNVPETYEKAVRMAHQHAEQASGILTYLLARNGEVIMNGEEHGILTHVAISQAWSAVAQACREG